MCGVPKPDVRVDRSGEQIGILQNYTKELPQIIQIEVPDIDAADPNGSAMNIIEP